MVKSSIQNQSRFWYLSLSWFFKCRALGPGTFSLLEKKKRDDLGIE